MVSKSAAFHSTQCQQCQTDACVLILALSSVVMIDVAILFTCFLRPVSLCRVQANSSVPSLFSVGFSIFFPYLSILFKENFLLWILCFAMGTFILTSSLILPDFLDWTGAAHLDSVPSSQRCFACCYLPFYLFFREQFLSFYFW